MKKTSTTSDTSDFVERDSHKTGAAPHAHEQFQDEASTHQADSTEEEHETVPDVTHAQGEEHDETGVEMTNL